jgi:LAO/AO transport system kinase
MWESLSKEISAGNIKSIARGITLVENEVEGYENLMRALPPGGNCTIIGVTGAPGAGKSTLVDALIGKIVMQEKKLAVLCVDPSSPFNLGAVLGDRVRMSEWYLHPAVYIRSLATRGAMGGLNTKIIEITELVKAAKFDFIIVETVGVGQSEIDIAGLADVTIVTLVPESGDEVQTMKAGLMEIADIFVVNKSDRPGADAFVKNLRLMLAPAFQQKKEIPILKTVASEKKGVDELFDAILQHHETGKEKKQWLMTEKAWQLISRKKMLSVNKEELKKKITKEMNENGFNLYEFVERY